MGVEPACSLRGHRPGPPAGFAAVAAVIRPDRRDLQIERQVVPLTPEAAHSRDVAITPRGLIPDPPRSIGDDAVKVRDGPRASSETQLLTTQVICEAGEAREGSEGWEENGRHRPASLA